MAEKLLLDLWKGDDGSRCKDTKPPILQDDDLDLLIVHETNSGYEIFACKGKGVMHVNYFGQEDANKVISVMKEKLSLISE